MSTARCYGYNIIMLNIGLSSPHALLVSWCAAPLLGPSTFAFNLVPIIYDRVLAIICRLILNVRSRQKISTMIFNCLLCHRLDMSAVTLRQCTAGKMHKNKKLY